MYVTVKSNQFIKATCLVDSFGIRWEDRIYILFLESTRIRNESWKEQEFLWWRADFSIILLQWIKTESGIWLLIDWNFLEPKLDKKPQRAMNRLNYSFLMFLRIMSHLLENIFYGVFFKAFILVERETSDVSTQWSIRIITAEYLCVCDPVYQILRTSYYCHYRVLKKAQAAHQVQTWSD